MTAGRYLTVFPWLVAPALVVSAPYWIGTFSKVAVLAFGALIWLVVLTSEWTGG